MELDNGRFEWTGQTQAFSDLGTNRVSLVSGYSDRSQDSDNGNYDHQLDKRKALLNDPHDVLIRLIISRAVRIKCFKSPPAKRTGRQPAQRVHQSLCVKA
jgi:hypothetical protein